VEKKLTVTEPAYEPPFDKECGIMYVLETKEDVARFVAAYGIRSRPGVVIGLTLG